MRVCGVELKANDAILSLVSLDNGLYTILECRVKKLSIIDAADIEQLKKFQFSFTKLMTDYQVDHVVIRERMTKGKFAGGAVGFKLEAAIQLSDLNVSLMSSSKVKESLKNSAFAMDYKEMGLKQFQENAFATAFAYMESL